MKKCNQCKVEMTVSMKTANHSIFKENITISNVPVLTCPTCGKEEYQDETKVDHLVRDAYRTKQHNVDYNNDGPSSN